MNDAQKKSKTGTSQPTEADWQAFYAYHQRIKLQLLLARG